MTEADAIQRIWDYMRLDHPLEPADVIVVLGCHNPDVASYAAELYHKGLAPFIVMSGGVIAKWADARWTGMTEADVFATIAIEAGVPAGKILRENRATNTSENFWFSDELLQEYGIKADSVIVAQMPSAERRFYATARHRWPDKKIMATSRRVDGAIYMHEPSEKQRRVSSMVGDFQRLEAYRGIMLADETIPAHLWSAFQTLIDQGYTGRLCEPVETTLARLEQNSLSKETNNA